MEKQTYLDARDIVQQIESTHRKITTICEVQRTSKKCMITIETEEGDIIETSFQNIKKGLNAELKSLKDHLTHLEEKFAKL